MTFLLLTVAVLRDKSKPQRLLGSVQSSRFLRVVRFRTKAPDWCRQRSETYLLPDTGDCEDHALVFLMLLNAPLKDTERAGASLALPNALEVKVRRSGPFKSLVIVCAL